MSQPEISTRNLSPENRPRPDPSQPDPPVFTDPAAAKAMKFVAGLVLLLPGIATVILWIVLLEWKGLKAFNDYTVWLISVPGVTLFGFGLYLLASLRKDR